MPRTFIDPPGALPVVGGEPEVGILHDPTDAAGGWIIVIVLKDIAERADRLLVGVAIVVADNLGVGAVRIHADGESADINVAVIARFSGKSRSVVGILERPDRLGTVGTEDGKSLS